MNFGHVLDPEREGEPSYNAFCRESIFAAHRKEYERLWSKYSGYEDIHYYCELPYHFLARFWEMFVAVTIIDSGFRISSSSIGPDVRFEVNGKTAWVEATAATSGEGHDRVPEMVYNAGPQEVPEREILLRYTNCLVEKPLVSHR